MKAVVAKQKQYEQELHLKKLNYDDFKLIGGVRKTVNKNPHDQGPVVKRFKLSQNQENTKQFTELKQVVNITNEGSSNTSKPNANGTLTRYATKPQTVSSKMAQKLQKQEERREKFIKKHEDLLNQVIFFVLLPCHSMLQTANVK